jgi:RHS repeat-associated protein
LTKTAADGWGNSGAASTQTIASGGGYVEFTATGTNTWRMCGLSHADANQDYTSIDFGLLAGADGNVYVYESGTQRGTFGAYATGDQLRVAIEAGVVKYKKNGSVFYTSTVTPSYPLLVDASLYTNGSTLTNVVISSGSGGSSSSSANINWLVTDQLGTPRMIFDQSGSLAATKRHDYAPFGEELFNGARPNVTGYAADSTRQKFTSKERDNETGLDYFGARYYGSTVGRFTSVDPGTVKLKHLLNPQKWNRYAYTLNNPLRFFDPDGMEEIEVVVRTFIPSREIHVPVHAKGDGRKAGEPGTFKTEIRVRIETDPAKNHGNPLVSESHKAGSSTEYRPVIGGDGRYTGETKEVKGQATGNSLHAVVSRQYQPGGGVPMVQIDVSGNEKYPLSYQPTTPGIKFDFSIGIQPNQYDSTGREITATISGGVAVFPETEILVKREGSDTYQLIYDHPPSGTTKTPVDLATQNPDQVTTQVKIKP